MEDSTDLRKDISQKWRNTMRNIYIYAVVNDKNNGVFVQFSTIFPDKDFAPRITLLNDTLNELGYNQLHFKSIIDSDVYMFGLVYNTVIEGNNIDFTRKDALMRELQNKISSFKRNDGHRASPSLLKYMRTRVEQSITIFNRYVIHPAH